MTIQNAWSNIANSLPTYAFADGQIGIQQADGALLTRNPDGTLKINLLPKRRGIVDSLIAIGPRETYIGVAITSSRSATLPSAAAYPPGQPLVIADEAGTLSATVLLTLTPSGSDTINGASSFVLSTAFGGATLYCDGVSKWNTRVATAGGVANAVLFTQQSLTAGQQDQARANISGAAPASQTATTGLMVLDIERDQYVTGTSTLTMPQTSPGWRTGIITNDNTVTGLVTLAVPSGHMLDGVTNGSTILFPGQRARLRMRSAGVWRTDWVDRSPILTILQPGAAVASWDFALPVGYKTFKLIANGIVPGTSGVLLQARLSDDGGATIKSGSIDYAYEYIQADGTNTITSGLGSAAQWQLSGGIYTANAPNTTQTEITIDPGGNGQFPSYRAFTTLAEVTTASRAVRLYGGVCTSIAANRANVFRILFSSGTGVGGFTLIGGP